MPLLVRWFGQSAYHLDAGDLRVVIDPHGDVESIPARGGRWDYPTMPALDAELLLITHEHIDHNGADKVAGEPAVVRSTAGTFDTPVARVTAIASEHDRVAGTERGPNALMVFECAGLRVCHLGDLGQQALRPEQSAAIGRPDVLFVPVGGGPTMGAAEAAAAVRDLAPKVVVPMHYRTPAIGFLEPVDGFLAAVEAQVHEHEAPTFDASDFLDGGTTVVVPAVPT